LPQWAPDGKEIAFNAILPTAPWNIYVIPSEGGAPERILPREESQMDANWSTDGHSLIFSSAPYVLNTPIYIIDLASKRVSTLPGSRGLRSAQWSPNGRFIAALTEEHPQTLKLFDFVTHKWTDEFGSDTGYDTWSHDGKYVYFEHSALLGASQQILRLRLADHKIEKVVDVKNVGRLTAGTFRSWFGLAPDGSPLVARDISTQEIYALEMDWP
jgi:Tol biopolymer transport system component